MRLAYNHTPAQGASRQGFTIVELLIVIVVIGILAGLVVLAYSSVQRDARIIALKSDLQAAAAQLESIRMSSDIGYPTNLANANLPTSDGTNFQYTSNGSDYCLTATSIRTGDQAFHVSSTASTVQEGACDAHIPPEPAVSAGESHTCAIISGQAYCWGQGTYGQLGNGNTASSSVPVAVSASGDMSDGTVRAISAGSSHTCAVADGQAYCWGSSSNGVIGDGGMAGNPNTPTAVSTAGVLAGKTVTAISAGVSHTCAIADGQAYCWGFNAIGQLGNGGTVTSDVPVAVSSTGVLAGKTVTAISAGGSHTCAIADGQAYCWGQGTSGQLGNVGFIASNTPVAVSTTGVLAGKTVTAISAGVLHTCAIADGQAYCWGQGTSRQLGNNASVNSGEPVAVWTAGVLSDKTVTAISAGGSHTCVVADSQAYCWGTGSSGRLGRNSTTHSTIPVAVMTSGVLANQTLTNVTSGYAHTCAITVDQAYCWGQGTNGKLGNNGTTGSNAPVIVSPLP